MRKTNSRCLRLTREELQEMEVLKKKLVSNSVLHISVPSLKTQLHTDASQFGLGSVPIQFNPSRPDEKRVIGDYNLRNNGAESC
jgi:hypothetical protein